MHLRNKATYTHSFFWSFRTILFAENALFRRITSEQLKTSGAETPLLFLKKHAVLLFQKAFDDVDVDLVHFNVSLTYYDTDGDQMIIHTPEDLTAALQEYMDAGKIKIFAQVQEKSPDDDSNNPVHTSTQTTNSTDHETLSVTDAVEHVVGAIASATIMAANQVTRSLGEIKRAERRIIKPIRVMTARRRSCRAKTTYKEARSADLSETSKDVPAGETKASQEEENVKSTRTFVNVDSKAEAVQEDDKKPAPKCEENKTSSVPLFIHGRHTCDGCLNTPIVGKRFHAKPDYDLCEGCFKNYSGDRGFEQVELGKSAFALLGSITLQPYLMRFLQTDKDQDRLYQERWKVRWDNFRRKGCVHACKAPSKAPRKGSSHPPSNQAGATNSLEEHDLDLKEAVRRSLAEVKKESTDEIVKPLEPTLTEALRRSDEQAEAEEAAAIEKAIQMSMEDAGKSEDTKTPVVSPAQSVASKSPTVSPARSVASKSPVVSPGRSVASKSSFAQDAAGCGDVANDLGEALDKIASEIDEMTLELGRPDEEKETGNFESDEEVEFAAEAVKDDDDQNMDSKKGATIVEGTEPELYRSESNCSSKNSWHVVDNDADGVVLDANAALGRAAQMIGSALFNSDMERSVQASTAPAEMLSSVSSVPTTVHLDRADPTSPIPDQLERWSLQLTQLHELGFLNDQVNVETIERLTAANIGVNCMDEVSVQQIIDEMMKDW